MRLKLDERDVQILSILQREGRITKTELARRVNLSATPCWERLQHLERTGIIEGYGARIAWNRLEGQTTVFMEVELDRHQSQDFERFECAMLSQPEVLECWALGGGIDYLLKVVTATIDDYQRFVDRLLAADLGLRRYYTYIVTKRIKQSEGLPETLLTQLRDG